MKYLLKFILLLFISPLSFSAQMPVQVDRDGTVIMEISGKINPNDGQKFINIAESWKRAGNPIQIIMLDSVGGSVFSGFDIAFYILNNGISTIIPNNSVCASSCFNIFLAGKPRVALLDSDVRVHRASERGMDTDYSRSISIDMNEFFKAMNVPSNIRLAMLETRPEDTYSLTKQDKQEISTLQLNYNKVMTVFNNSSIKQTRSTINNNSKEMARKLNKEAIPLIWNDNLSLAISKLEQAKIYNPSDSEILGNLGFAYQKIGDLKNAQINFTASLKLTPKRGATWGNLANLLADTGEIDWAVDAFVNYYNYSKNKQAALNLFYEWIDKYPNTGRDVAVRQAMARLKLY